MSVFVFVIEHAMAEAFKIRICDLIAEFFAHAFILRDIFSPARAEASPPFKSLSHCRSYLLIGIFFDMHNSPFLCGCDLVSDTPCI